MVVRKGWTFEKDSNFLFRFCCVLPRVEKEFNKKFKLKNLVTFTAEKRALAIEIIILANFHTSA